VVRNGRDVYERMGKEGYKKKEGEVYDGRGVGRGVRRAMENHRLVFLFINFYS